MRWQAKGFAEGNCKSEFRVDREKILTDATVDPKLVGVQNILYPELAEAKGYAKIDRDMETGLVSLLKPKKFMMTTPGEGDYGLDIWKRIV